MGGRDSKNPNTSQLHTPYNATTRHHFNHPRNSKFPKASLKLTTWHTPCDLCGGVSGFFFKWGFFFWHRKEYFTSYLYIEQKESYQRVKWAIVIKNTELMTKSYRKFWSIKWAFSYQQKCYPILTTHILTNNFKSYMHVVLSFFWGDGEGDLMALTRECLKVVLTASDNDQLTGRRQLCTPGSLSSVVSSVQIRKILLGGRRILKCQY